MRPEENTLKLFHCTYPNHPSTCETELIAEVEYPPGKFVSKESAFRQFASENRVRLEDSSFDGKVTTLRGLRTDQSSLICRQPDGSYYKIAFYS